MGSIDLSYSRYIPSSTEPIRILKGAAPILGLKGEKRRLRVKSTDPNDLEKKIEVGFYGPKEADIGLTIAIR